MTPRRFGAAVILPFLFLFLLSGLPVRAGEEPSPDPQAQAKWRRAMSAFMRLRRSRKPEERVQAAREIRLGLKPGVHKEAAHLLVALLSEEIARGKKKEEKVTPRVIEVVVTTLEKLTEPEAIAYLLDVVKNIRYPWRVRFQVIEALGARENPKVIEALREAAGSPDAKIRIGAIDALSRIGSRETLDVFLKGLMDPAWQVKIACIQALSRLSLGVVSEKDRIIEGLIGALGRTSDEEGRLKWEIVTALRNITYEKFGVEATEWENWWARRKRGEEAMGNAGHTKAMVPEYHGLKIYSTRIVFVIDTTGSMADPATKTESSKRRPPPFPLPPQVTGAARTKTDKSLIEKMRRLKEKNDKREVKTKLDAEKKELINAILLLSPKVQFTIVTYAETARPWRPRLVPATPQNKLKAVQAIEKLIPSGGTDIYKALVAAFQIHGAAAPRKPGGGARGVKVTGGGGKRPVAENIQAPADEIYLLTDGCPTIGEMTDPTRICAEIRKINKIRKVRINTIGVGTPGQGATPINPSFLRRLASENGGKFVHVK